MAFDNSSGYFELAQAAIVCGEALLQRQYRGEDRVWRREDRDWRQQDVSWRKEDREWRALDVAWRAEDLRFMHASASVSVDKSAHYQQAPHCLRYENVINTDDGFA